MEFFRPHGTDAVPAAETALFDLWRRRGLQQRDGTTLGLKHVEGPSTGDFLPSYSILYQYIYNIKLYII